MKHDTYEEVQMCLHCIYPTCINCLGGRSYGRIYRKHEEWKKAIKEFAELGMTDREMGGLLSISPNTVAKLRTELGIPPQRGRGACGRARKDLQNLLRKHNI